MPFSPQRVVFIHSGGGEVGVLGEKVQSVAPICALSGSHGGLCRPQAGSPGGCQAGGQHLGPEAVSLSQALERLSTQLGIAGNFCYLSVGGLYTNPGNGRTVIFSWL